MFLLIRIFYAHEGYICMSLIQTVVFSHGFESFMIRSFALCKYLPKNLKIRNTFLISESF